MTIRQHEAFIIMRCTTGMESTRKGLRAGHLKKDTYERLLCVECDENLDTKNDPDKIGRVRVCPDCGGEWTEIG